MHDVFSMFRFSVFQSTYYYEYVYKVISRSLDRDRYIRLFYESYGMFCVLCFFIDGITMCYYYYQLLVLCYFSNASARHARRICEVQTFVDVPVEQPVLEVRRIIDCGTRVFDLCILEATS